MSMKLIIGSLILIRIFVYYYNDALTDIYSNFSIYFPFFNITTYLDLTKFVIVPLFVKSDNEAQGFVKSGSNAKGSVPLFTEDELKKYNGENSDLLYLAILGNVFDVTSGASYYGVGKVYHGFTGNDLKIRFCMALHVLPDCFTFICRQRW